MGRGRTCSLYHRGDKWSRGVASKTVQYRPATGLRKQGHRGPKMGRIQIPLKGKLADMGGVLGAAEDGAEQAFAQRCKEARNLFKAYS